MENTQINKIKFFAQYWGQRVWRRTQGENNLLYINTDTLSAKRGNMNGDFLELKPLSSITDEDAIEVAKFMSGNYNLKKVLITQHDDNFFKRKWTRVSKEYIIEEEVKTEIIFNISNEGLITHTSAFRHEDYIRITDLLRSKGYALPFHNLSVEQLIEYGWIKLKTE